MLDYEPAVYCGTYAKYNNGSLYGAWLKFSDYSDAEDFFNACKELHQDEKDPEFMFQGFENFPRDLYFESMDIEECEAIYRYLELCQDHDKDLVDALNDCIDLDEVEENLDSTYYLTDSDDDYSIGEAYIDSFGGLEQLDNATLMQYFDFEAFGRDLRINSRIIKSSDGKVYYSFY